MLPDDHTPLERELGHIEGALDGFVSQPFPLGTPGDRLANAVEHRQAHAAGGTSSDLSSAAIDGVFGSIAADVAADAGRTVSEILEDLRVQADALERSGADALAALDDALHDAGSALTADAFDDAAKAFVRVAAAAAVAASR